MCGARLDGPEEDGKRGMALNAHGVETGLDLFLRGMTAKGTVYASGAKIGGQLSCVGAELDGAGDMALNAQRLHVTQGLIWRDVTVASGAVLMSAAQVSDLADDGRWPAGVGALDLDGFTYDRITGNTAPVTAAGRRGWLRAGSVWKGRFYPQPYTQLARVFRAMGHGGEARMVLFWREQEVFRQARRDLLAAPVGQDDMVFGTLGREVRAAGVWAGDWLLRIVAGYGYRPLRALGCLIVLWAVAAVLAWQVWHEGSFAPNSDVVLVSEGWQRALMDDCIPAAVGCDPNPAQTWSNDPARGLDWDSFSSLGYAADLVVPVLDLGQTDAWAPSKDRGWWGWGLWWGRWVLIAFGWIVTAIGAAAVTGIMQKDRE